jgi:hypothetical protein
VKYVQPQGATMQKLEKKRFTLKLYHYFLVVLASLTLFANHAFADSCDNATIINSFPYYITSSGMYCLADSMTFKSNSNSAISAITISAGDVELNLNGNAIKGPLAPKDSIPTGGHEIGISVTGYVNYVWIHNGSLVGLPTGIGQWTNTGSTTNAFYNMNSALCVTCGLSYTYAINVKNLTNSSILGNKIMGIHTYGDQWPGYGMYIANSSDININNNTIVDEPFSQTNNTAIIAVSSTNINMSGNTFSNIYRGIWYFYSSGTYGGTAYVNTTVPYTGGTDGGGNQ